jgi:hypothetical protein
MALESPSSNTKQRPGKQTRRRLEINSGMLNVEIQEDGVSRGKFTSISLTNQAGFCFFLSS